MATTSSKAMNEDRGTDRSSDLNRTNAPMGGGAATAKVGTQGDSPLTEKLGDLSGDIASRENIQALKEQATEKLGDVRARFGEFTSQYRDSAREYVDKANTYVRANPFQALVVGFGVGILLGALFSPRRYYS